MYACLEKNVCSESMLIILSDWIFVIELFQFFIYFGSVQFSSVAQSCLTLCDPMNCSMPGLPVHHHLPEFTQTHVYRVRDAIQPSHPRSSPSPPAPNPCQHQSPLDCKEIQPVHSEGDQPWDFFGRNDAKAETLVLWPPHTKG